MERLTTCKEITPQTDMTQEYGYTHIYKRLAEYEDLGLTPKEIEKYKLVYNKCMDCPIVCIKDEYIKALDIIDKSKEMDGK